MKKPGLIRRMFKSVLDIRAWTDIDQHKNVFTYYLRQALRLPSVPKINRKETFEEALERLHLREAEIKRQSTQALHLSIIFFVLALMLFGYGIFLAWQKHTFGFIVTFLLTLVLLTKAFYFNFWHFQIKHRKLGCSIAEWLNGRVEKDEYES